jgi:hypothetical protein
MPRTVERMKRAFLHRDVILHYDGEYWWAHDTIDEEDTIIYKHSVLDVVIEAIDEYFIKNPPKKKQLKEQQISEGN